MQAIPYLAGAIALAALALAGFFYRYVRAADPGSPRMVQLMDAIAGGARHELSDDAARADFGDADSRAGQIEPQVLRGEPDGSLRAAVNR